MGFLDEIRRGDNGERRRLWAFGIAASLDGAGVETTITISATYGTTDEVAYRWTWPLYETVDESGQPVLSDDWDLTIFNIREELDWPENLFLSRSG